MTVHQGDCIEVMRGMADNSVDLILTDPPYFRVKNEPWDRQWATADGFLVWLDRVAEQWQRVLKPNGSLYCFASPRMAARVEVTLGRRFEILNSVVWAKEGFGRHSASCKETLRAFFPNTERIVFAEHFGSDNIAKGEAGYIAKCDELRGFVFEPIRAYLDGERVRAGITREQIETATATQMFSHWFSQSQWAIPTDKHYATMRELFNANGGDYLRREYDDLRRPFSVTADVPYTDVWTFPTVQSYPGKHTCEKPQAMLRHIIAASSRPNAVVLDSFAGSGSTGEAAIALGRQFVGVELSEHWARVARDRVAPRSDLFTEAA